MDDDIITLQGVPITELPHEELLALIRRLMQERLRREKDFAFMRELHAARSRRR
jgi:hypothetical protein